MTPPVIATADLVTLLASTQQQTEDEGYGLQAGPYAFVFFVALALATVFLLFSLRKQMRRVDFDESGTTDAERMRPPDGTSTGAPDDEAR